MAMRNKDIRDEIAPLVERLAVFHQRSGPQSEDLTEEEKADLAREALNLWWDIYDQLMSWVGHEYIGQLLLKENRQRVSAVSKLKPLGAKERAVLNEAVGLWYAQMGTIPENVRADIVASLGKRRLALVEMAAQGGVHDLPDMLMNNFMPPPLREITAQLRALEDTASSAARDSGAPATGLEPIVDEDATTRWRLEALRRVRARVGKGKRKIYALSEVADSIEQSIDTLQAWERELVKSSDLENDLFCAELAGEFEGHFVSSHYTTIFSYERYGSYKGLYNLERAAAIAQELQHLRLIDIAAALRAVN